MEQHHEHHQTTHHQACILENDIKTTVTYNGNTLLVHLKDNEGNAPILGVTHEKLLHLIVGSEDLNEYYHLHPVKINEFTFEKKIILTGYSYRAFVDMNPIGKTYHIEPIVFINETSSQAHHRHVDAFLKVDRQFKKIILGKIVQFEHEPFVVGKNIKLTFKTKNDTPKPYLGALGHVVIIDDEVSEFIHVHPISDNETVFEAFFAKPGVYKLWAEFKFDEEVIAFPYVFEVTL